MQKAAPRSRSKYCSRWARKSRSRHTSQPYIFGRRWQAAWEVFLAASGTEARCSASLACQRVLDYYERATPAAFIDAYMRIYSTSFRRTLIRGDARDVGMPPHFSSIDYHCFTYSWYAAFMPKCAVFASNSLLMETPMPSISLHERHGAQHSHFAPPVLISSTIDHSPQRPLQFVLLQNTILPPSKIRFLPDAGLMLPRRRMRLLLLPLSPCHMSRHAQHYITTRRPRAAESRRAAPGFSPRMPIKHTRNIADLLVSLRMSRRKSRRAHTYRAAI